MQNKGGRHREREKERVCLPVWEEFIVNVLVIEESGGEKRIWEKKIIEIDPEGSGRLRERRGSLSVWGERKGDWFLSLILDVGTRVAYTSFQIFSYFSHFPIQQAYAVRALKRPNCRTTHSYICLHNSV